jgi:hypothetical protein
MEAIMTSISTCTWILMLIAITSAHEGSANQAHEAKAGMPLAHQGSANQAHEAKADIMWSAQAAANLSQWRYTLMERTFQAYNEHSIQQRDKLQSHERFTHPVEPPGHARFGIFQPFISCPPSSDLRRIGDDGDGGKWLCLPKHLKAPCLIISLCSNGQFDFEQAVLDVFPCEVHTFDCTSTPQTLEARHHFHKLCIGKPAHGFVSLDEAVRLTGFSSLDLLKMDIEGYEFDVVSSWEAGSRSLPKQLSVELHYQDLYYGTPAWKDTSRLSLFSWPGISEVGLAQLSLFFAHLAGLGYGVVAQEVNELSEHCSEFTMILVSQFHHASVHGGLGVESMPPRARL